MSTTTGTSASVTSKTSEFARARSMKSCTAGYANACSRCHGRRLWGGIPRGARRCTVSAANLQRLAAGCQDMDAPGAAEDVVGEHGRRIDHMLAIVEDKERILFPE